MARYLSSNHLLFLTLAIACARSLTGWAAQVPDSSVVTTMARNGTHFGAKLSASPAWCYAPSPMVGSALFHPGRASRTPPDIGDSAVLELIRAGRRRRGGLTRGRSVGGRARGRRRADRRAGPGVRRAQQPVRPADARRPRDPLGVDVRRVVEHGITPKVTTGILHRSAGAGQIGAGVAVAPVRASAARCSISTGG